MAVDAGAVGRRHGRVDQHDVVGNLLGIFHDEAAGDLRSADQHAAPGAGQCVIQVDGQRAAAFQNYPGNAVAFDLGCAGCAEGFDVQGFGDRLDLDIAFRRAEFQLQAVAGAQRLPVEPEEPHGQPVGFARPLIRRGDQRTPLDEDILVQRQGDAVAGNGVLPRPLSGVAMPALQGGDGGLSPQRRESDPVADLQPAALDPADHDAAVIHPVEILYRQAQRLFGRAGARREGIQSADQRQAPIPARGAAAGGDVVAAAGRDRHKRRGFDADIGKIAAHRFGHCREARLVVIDQIDLVDGDSHLPDSQQVQQIGMAPGLLGQALLGIHHEDGGIGLGGAGNHVLEELLVARRVDDHIAPPLGGEPDLGRVHRNSLVAFDLEGIEQE